jgi:hypothetical protein
MVFNSTSVFKANEVKTPSKTPSAPTPAFSILISELQLQNITIKLLLFHLIKKILL